MKNIVIAGYCRSPFMPAHKGAFLKLRPDDLTAQVVKGLIRKTAVNPDEIEDLILGCAFPEAEQGMNMARLVVFFSGASDNGGRDNTESFLWLINASYSHGCGGY
ncbi:MAG: hypothetical protein Q9M50_07820 [Methylococcales bacterium]|nr:hypothetical protein [Methylococcales bacterium]